MRVFIIFIFLIIGLGFSFYNNQKLDHQDRVVTLSPAHTLFFEYLELCDKVVGISQYDTNPIFQNRKKITGGVFFEEEEVLKLNPSIVTIGDIQKSSESILFLESKGISSVLLPTTSLEDIYSSLKIIYNKFSNDKSKKKLHLFYQQWDEIKKTLPLKQRNVLIIVDIDPIYSVSTNSYLSEVYKYSGWNNIVTTETPYPILTEEQLFSLKKIDDIIISSFLTNELSTISNIQRIVKAKNIVINPFVNTDLPSPYLLDTIKELRKLNSSYY